MKRNYTSPNIIEYTEVFDNIICTSGGEAPEEIQSLGIMKSSGPVNGSDALGKERSGFASFEEDFANGWK